MGQTRRFRPSRQDVPAGTHGAATALTERATREWPSAAADERAEATYPIEELVLGRYRLRRRLGTGGFGSVWLARDERLERDVAIKLLARERIVGGRFEREARATARLNHPGIVTLYEAAIDDDGAYLVSELVRGSTLGRLLQQGCLSDRDIGLAALALCDALEYAHDQGVVHRDVKPSNILVPERPHTTAEVAKLTDFGVAHVIGGDSLTRTGDVIGTTAYMSPEQAEGREVQPCADLYSLGVVIYEALTGVNPLRLTDPAVRGGRLGAHLPPLRRHRRDLPRELGCAVDLALRPRSRERGTIAELREAIGSAVKELDDQPGNVASPWPASDPSPRLSPRPAEAPLRRPEGGHWPQDDRRGGHAQSPRRRRADLADPAVSWPGRITAGTAAAVATAWFAATLLPGSAALPVVAMGAAAVLVAALPRLGWIGLVATGATVLVLQDLPGAAILLGLAALPVVLLLIRSSRRWPLPAMVPALSVPGLAGAWPALAGRTSTAWQRLVLGAAGWLWLVVGELLGGSGLYFSLPPGIPPIRVWGPSIYDTYHQVLHSSVFPGLLAPAVVWGIGAVLLPRPDQPARRVVVVLIWGLVVAGLSDALLAALATGAAVRPLPAVLGALACAALAALPQPPTPRALRQRAPTPGLDSRSMEMR